MTTRGVERTCLDNGVRIVTQQMPHLHSVSMGIWVNVGARDETAAENGLSHMIEHMIFKGTSRRSAYQIAKAFDAIGGYTNAFTSPESTCYHAKVLDTHLDPMVEILADIFFNSLFAEEEFQRERDIVLQEIRMVEDSPEDLVHTLAYDTFWGEHPLGRSILGTPQTLGGFDAERIRSFFRHNYQPDRIVISAAGNLTHERIVALLAPAFAGMPGGSGLAPRLAPQARTGIVVHPRAIEQVHLCLTGPGLSITDEHRYTLSLLNAILGGNMSSRLFQAIREQLGLAYAVYSFVSAYQDSGMLGVYAAVAPENTGEAIRRILEQMRRLAAEPVSAERLDEAKQYTRGSLILAAENNDHQMTRLAQNEIYFDRYIPLDEVVQCIDAVSAADIQNLAAALFTRDGLALTLLGPVPKAAAGADLLGG